MCNFLAASIFFLVPSHALAHASYLIGDDHVRAAMGRDYAFFLTPLSNPFYVFLIIATIFFIIALHAIIRNSAFLIELCMRMCERAKSYEEYIPLILRLSVGLALLDLMGLAQAIIVPLLPYIPHTAFVQATLAFSFLAGFLLAPAILLAILLFFFSLVTFFGTITFLNLIGDLDFFASVIALLILANPKPGLDDVLGISFFSPFTKLKAYVPLILRIGMGSTLVFLAFYEKILNPHVAETLVLHYHLTSIIPVSVEMWVFTAGIIELLAGFFLFVGFHTRTVAAAFFAVISLSFLYFGELVYPHTTIFGVMAILFITGGGLVSIDEWWKNRLHSHSI